MQFAKYQALGNDYLVFDGNDGATSLSSQAVRKVCDRHRGIGSDGILVHESSSDRNEFRLRILNPDGTEAEKSGNGLRIFARYLWDQRVVGEAPFSVITLGGRVRCQVMDQGRSVIVDMGQVRFSSPDIPVLGPPRDVLRETLVIGDQSLEYSVASIGNPQCVLLRQCPSEAEARLLGPLIETDSRFPNRINVQFMQVLDRRNIRIEIWERGAGYTLASGSSSCAADFFVRMTGPVAKVADCRLSGEVLDLPTHKRDSNCLDVVPELPVADLVGTLKWFREMLGFGTAWAWENSFAAVSSGEVQLYLRKTDSPAAGMRRYLHVKDADRLYDRCQQQGARITDQIESKPWGAREFAVEVPGGHILRVGHGEKRVDEISQFTVGGNPAPSLEPESKGT